MTLMHTSAGVTEGIYRQRQGFVGRRNASLCCQNRPKF